MVDYIESSLMVNRSTKICVPYLMTRLLPPLIPGLPGYACYCGMPSSPVLLHICILPSSPVLLHIHILPSSPVLLHIRILPSSPVLLYIYCTCFSTFWHCHTTSFNNILMKMFLLLCFTVFSLYIRLQI